MALVSSRQTHALYRDANKVYKKSCVSLSHLGENHRPATHLESLYCTVLVPTETYAPYITTETPTKCKKVMNIIKSPGDNQRTATPLNIIINPNRETQVQIIEPNWLCPHKYLTHQWRPINDGSVYEHHLCLHSVNTIALTDICELYMQVSLSQPLTVVLCSLLLYSLCELYTPPLLAKSKQVFSVSYAHYFNYFGATPPSLQKCQQIEWMNRTHCTYKMVMM